LFFFRSGPPPEPGILVAAAHGGFGGRPRREASRARRAKTENAGAAPAPLDEWMA
jgi:hypothetical protein